MIWILLVFVLAAVVYWKFFRNLDHWKKRNVVHKRPWPFVGNNLKEALGLLSLPDAAKNLYEEFINERVSGTFQFSEPGLVIRDLDLFKQITVKEFDHFTDHLLNFSDDVDPFLGKNLFFLQGQAWKDMRSTLSPAFTSSKLKSMFHLIKECTEQFTSHFLKRCDQNELLVINMKEETSRYANDVIASTAFGVKCDSFEDKENEFFVMGKKITDTTGITAVKFILSSIAPALLKILDIPILSRKQCMYFKKIVQDNISTRDANNIVRPDLIHLLMEARKGRLKHEDQIDEDAGFASVQESDIGKSSASTQITLTDDLITAQALIFFFAGFDTISTVLSFCTYELALNPEVQDRLSEEIDDFLKENNGTFNYEQVMKLKYLDMVISETMRKWPPAPVLDRVCTKDFVIERPEQGNPLEVKKGDLIILPVMGIHLDPKYHPNPDKFDPDRFSDENKDDIVPYSYIPFGFGPRSCIASRFALLELKLMLAQLISHFKIEVVDKTPIPFKFERNTLNVNAEAGFWLGLKRRGKQ